MKFRSVFFIVACLGFAAPGVASAQKSGAAPAKASKAGKAPRDNFRPDHARKPTYGKPKISPKLHVETWGQQTTTRFQANPPQPAVRRDPYQVQASGVPRGTSVTLQAQEKSAKVEYQGRPTGKDVAAAQRFAKPFDKFKTTGESPAATTTVDRPQELDTHTPIRATFKDQFGRTQVRTVNAQGRQRTVISNNSVPHVENGQRGHLNTTVEDGGEFLEAYKPWTAKDNLFVTRASRPMNSGDYEQMAKQYTQRAQALEGKLGKAKGPELRSLQAQIRHASTAAKEAQRQTLRLRRVNKAIRYFEKKLATVAKNTPEHQNIAKQIASLKAQLPEVKADSSVRFVALAAFPANATVTFTNLRMQADGQKNFSVTKKANGSGSLDTELPAWQADRVKVTVAFPAEAGKSLGSSQEFTMTLAKNDGAKGAFKTRGVKYSPVTSLEIEESAPAAE